MAVAPASMADKIIVLDDDEEEGPQPSTAVSRRSQKKHLSPLKAAQPAPTHIPQSPFASAKKEPRVLQAENEKLFEEFIEHCTAQTQDCPEVITFLKTKYTKASSSFLSSVEFRNFLGRCLTRAQANRSKTFVYINELCTVLRQHGDKKRQSLAKSELSTTKSASNLLSSEPKPEDKAEADAAAEEEEQPSTSGVNEDTESDRKSVRKSRKQIAYLENLLKVYNDEIRRLQESDLSLDDLEAEDSLYIQEHRLKRKMMKIYEKLCELKNCTTLTGRVLEQRISYSGSRFPEINKRIEKFINSAEARDNPPDYPDIYQQVLRANDRYKLCLPRKRLTEIAKEAFRDIASRIQDRRHLDLVFNFGSHLTDSFKPASDPAFVDPTLSRKLRSNRELARTRLDEVIAKYASKQEDTEEQERQKRTDKSNKEGNESKSSKKPEANGVEEKEKEEEEPEEEDDEDNEDNEDGEDDEDDQSSDPDIEEEIQASSQLDGAEGVSEEEEESNEAEQAVDDADKDQLPPSVSASEKDEEDISDLSPLSQQSKSLLTPLSTSPQDSPSQSEPAPSDEKGPVSNGTVESTNQKALTVLPAEGKNTKDNATDVSENGVKMVTCETSSSTSDPDKTRMTRAQKRKREEVISAKPKHDITCDSDTDIPLEMGARKSPPRPRAETPPYVSSSQATPPPKKNKVNVATQCDPQEVIELSDSD